MPIEVPTGGLPSCLVFHGLVCFNIYTQRDSKFITQFKCIVYNIGVDIILHATLYIIINKLTFAQYIIEII